MNTSKAFQARRALPFLATLLVAICGLIAPAHAAFPGQNGKIAYVNVTHPYWDQIWVMNSDGSGARPVTQGEGVRDFSPQWSPDGERIAFNRCRNFGDYGCGIHVVNSDGTGLTQLTDAPEGDVYPAWSPDGRRIAFLGQREIGEDGVLGDTWVVNADGSGLRKLSDRWGLHLEWSPDGTQIAFDDRYNIWVMDSDGTNPTRLTDNVRGSPAARYPNWSPRGDKITFMQSVLYDDEGIPIGWDILVMNADGSGKTNITNTQYGCCVHPVWSPDGTSIIAWPTGLPPHNRLLSMNPDGSDQVVVPEGGTEPDWQPIPSPRRENFSSALAFCKAERDFWGDERFRERYGTNEHGANAHGKCVSGNQ